MSGVRGKSGRKKGSGMSAAAHALRGTYRPDRHGPLSDGTRVLQMPPPTSLLLSEDLLGVPAHFSDAERAKMNEMVARFPWVIGHELLAVYCAVWCDWVEARKKIGAFGYVVKGPGGKVVPSPFVAFANTAVKTLIDLQGALGLARTADGKATVKEQSRLERFLAAKSRR